MNGIDLELKEKAFGLCRDYLRGRWATISLDQFRINVLGGGLSNELYICSLPEDGSVLPDNTSPHRVLLRIYGQLYGELVSDVHALISDTVVFALLAERKIAPKLYAVFPEGRLEQFLPARNLTFDELRMPTYNVKIAQKVAMFHQLELPLCKRPVWVWQTIERLLQDINDIEFGDKEKAQKFSQLKNMDLHQELKWLKEFIEALNPGVAFCHNDLQEGNVLIVPNGDGSRDFDLRLIDFEYSAYCYRSFDFANYFCEWLFDYKEPSFPMFKAHPDNWPSKEQQLLFVRAYLEEINEPTLREDTILAEIEKLALLSHFLWGVWAIVQAKFSNIEFGYMDYAVSRFEAYEQRKKDLGLSWDVTDGTVRKMPRTTSGHSDRHVSR